MNTKLQKLIRKLEISYSEHCGEAEFELRRKTSVMPACSRLPGIGIPAAFGSFPFPNF